MSILELYGLESNIWAVSDPRLIEAMAITPAQAMEIIPQSARGRPTVDPLEARGRVGVLEISGVLSRRPSIFRFFGIGNATLDEIESAAIRARQDDGIETVVLDISSPGGEANGIDAAASAIAELAAHKRAIAVVRGVANSGALWLASQASEVVVSETSEVGGLGAFCVVRDTSELTQRMGIKVHVVSTAPLKGIGQRGAAVTEGQLAECQRSIDALNERFVAAVARGRGMSLEAARALADGRTHIGSDAVALGLADRVGTLRGVLTDLETGMSKPTSPTPASAGSGETEPAAVSTPAVGTRQLTPTGPSAAPVTEPVAASNPDTAALAAQVTALQAQLAEAQTLQASLAATQQATAEAQNVSVVQAAIGGLSERLTPAVTGEGLEQALAAVRAANVQCKVGDQQTAAYDVLLGCLGKVTPPSAFGAGAMATWDPPRGTAAGGIDDARKAELAAKYPTSDWRTN